MKDNYQAIVIEDIYEKDRKGDTMFVLTLKFPLKGKLKKEKQEDKPICYNQKTKEKQRPLISHSGYNSQNNQKVIKEESCAEKKPRVKAKSSLIAVLLLISAALLCLFSLSVCENVKEKTTINGREYSLSADDETKRENFLQSFGLKADTLLSERKIIIPPEFNDTYRKYNELQNLQGLDLEQFRSKEVDEYVYSLSDCDIEGESAYAVMLIYKGKVIAGHLTNFLENSTVFTFTKDSVNGE